MLVGDLVADTTPDAENDGEESKSTFKGTTAKVVTEENISEFTIFDVVMPLIGKSIALPQHPELKALYESYMEQDGITLEMFADKSMDGSCAHGAYRHIGKQFHWNGD